jgi:ubiquitin carboxyl-terminal hydrolase 25/28
MANNDNKKASDARSDSRSIPEGVASIPPSTFYGTQSQSQRPPPLPNRPAAPALGSSSTAHYTIQASEKSPFREPELVPDDSEQPALETYPSDQGSRPFVYDTTPSLGDGWGNIQEGPWPSQSGQFYGSTSTDVQPERWVANAPPATWGTFEDGWTTGSARRSVPIDGRNEAEEMRWWDARVREDNARPGQGILPPVLADRLHNPEHTLFSVTVTPPDLKPALPPAPTQPQPTQSESPNRHSHRSSDSGSSLHAGGSSPAANAPPTTSCSPTAEDVHTAVPHPNAYYCRKHNGWVLLIWKSSSVNPPLARSFTGTLPDQSRRRSTNSCVSDGEQTMGPVNVTHHFHAYERAVDARRLTHPFNASEWEHEERSKLRHRKMTLRGSDPTAEATELGQAADEVEREDEEGDLLDLYVCCQCSFYVVASNVIPGVVPVKLLEDLIKNKVENPPPDKSGELTALITLEMILT